MTRESKLVANRDEPLGGVPLVPFHRVPIIHRELMVKVVVTLPERHECRDEMVFWRVLIIECAFSQPMSQRVDCEGRLGNFTWSHSREDNNVVRTTHMMNCDHPKKTGIKITATPVTPRPSRDHGGNDDSPG